MNEILAVLVRQLDTCAKKVVTMSELTCDDCRHCERAKEQSGEIQAENQATLL